MPSKRRKAPAKNLDSAFREIFSSPLILHEFIQMFLSRLLKSGDIRESDITIHNTDFLSSDLRSKRPDVLFSVKTKGEDLYVYILIEHQSYKDPNMPYRIYDYVGRILGHIIRQNPKASGRKSFRYPPIIPVVFYTGKGRWTIERDIREKFPNAGGYEDYLPSLRYMVIEVSGLDREWLFELKTALSKMLYYMKAEDVKELVRLFEKAVKDLFGVKYEVFKRGIKTLLIGSGASVKEADEIVDELTRGKEARGMIRLFEAAEKKGMLEAKREDIYEILEERFSEVPQDIKEAVEKITNAKKLSFLLRKSISVKDLDEFRELLKTSSK